MCLSVVMDSLRGLRPDAWKICQHLFIGTIDVYFCGDKLFPGHDLRYIVDGGLLSRETAVNGNEHKDKATKRGNYIHFFHNIFLQIRICSDETCNPSSYRPIRNYDLHLIKRS